MHATDIVAYTYQAEMLCPRCVIGALDSTGILDASAYDDAEATLTHIALQSDINRSDERLFDSGDFPKVVFADQVEDCGTEGCTPESCGNASCDSCGEALI